MRKRSLPLVLGLAMVAGIAACEPAPEAETGAESQMPAAEPAPDPAPAQMPLSPDTTAEAVWAHIQEADYEQTWQHWPDRDPYYQGTQPHGALLSTYLNEIAGEALAGQQTPMPDGAMIVKKNFMPDSTLAATTVMYKVDGYAPDAGNWFWAKYGPEGDVQAAGHAESCMQCHNRAADDFDYLITAQQDASG